MVPSAPATALYLRALCVCVGGGGQDFRVGFFGKDGVCVCVRAQAERERDSSRAADCFFRRLWPAAAPLAHSRVARLDHVVAHALEQLVAPSRGAHAARAALDAQVLEHHGLGGLLGLASGHHGGCGCWVLSFWAGLWGGRGRRRREARLLLAFFRFESVRGKSWHRGPSPPRRAQRVGEWSALQAATGV